MNSIKLFFSKFQIKVYGDNGSFIEEVLYSTLLGIDNSISFSDIMTMYNGKFINLKILGERIIDYLLSTIFQKNVSGNYCQKLNEFTNQCQLVLLLNYNQQSCESTVSSIFEHRFKVRIENGDNTNSLRDSNKTSIEQTTANLSQHSLCPNDGNMFFDGIANTEDGPMNDQCFDCDNVARDTKIEFLYNKLSISCRKAILTNPLTIYIPANVLNRSFPLPEVYFIEINVLLDQKEQYVLKLRIEETSEKIEVVCMLKDQAVVVMGRVDNNEYVSADCYSSSEYNFISYFEPY